jgi:hypothetical protein
MHTIREPYSFTTTTTLRVGPKRPSSLVILDSNGFRIVDHPIAGARHSMLMVEEGCGDLARNRPRIMATRLLGLPEVVPPEQRGRTHVEVPLLPADALDSPAYTTWTIAGAPLLVDQIDSDKAQLTFKRSLNSPDIKTLELLPAQWWHVVQALLSLDSWMQYLKSTLDAVAQDVRRSVQTDSELFRVVGAFMVERDNRPRGGAGN